MEIRLLYFDACPNWREARRRLDDVLADLDDAPEVEMVAVGSPEQAEQLGFRGSPTILVDGEDVLATGDEPVGLACRVYQTPDGPHGVPTTEQLRRALA